MECVYSLLQFGCPTDKLPIGSFGSLETALHQRWIKEMAREEALHKKFVASSGIIIPTTHDVLLGRGKSTMNFPGNVTLANMIDRYRAEYQTLGRAARAEFVLRIVSAISQNGRFLQRKEGLWEMSSEDAAREKVAHGFRNPPRRKSQGKTH